MDQVEYERLDRIDGNHWFYHGKRRIVRHWISKAITPMPCDLLIDVGCGTGRFLLEWGGTSAFGVDSSPESLNLARQKVSIPLVQGELPRLPFRCRTAAIVIALDVLEHCLDDASSIKKLVRLLRPGGVLCITVPALPWLWSDWDESLHHFRRYTLGSLLKIVPPDVEVLRCSYINELALLPIWIVRSLRGLLGSSHESARAEDTVPAVWVNRLLEESLVWLACRTHYRAPVGASLLLILRRGV